MIVRTKSAFAITVVSPIGKPVTALGIGAAAMSAAMVTAPATLVFGDRLGMAWAEVPNIALSERASGPLAFLIARTKSALAITVVSPIGKPVTALGVAAAAMSAAMVTAPATLVFGDRLVMRRRTFPSIALPECASGPLAFLIARTKSALAITVVFADRPLL